MNPDLVIRPMRPEDLKTAIGWAEAEGWNPGLDDAAVFHRADPGGFLMGWLGDQPATAISVVAHSDRLAFLGFYLCHPRFRGAGHGFATWQAGMALGADRVIGLDGVPAQQQNYASAGFALAHQTRRHGGVVTGRPHAEIEQSTASDIAALLSLDASVQGGTDRARYAADWFGPAPTRLTMVRRGPDGIDAAGTIRACVRGHKIGPLYAPDAETAGALIEALVAEAGAAQVFMDTPDSNAAGVSLCQQFGLVPAFACARMYRGPAPDRAVGRIFGEMTFELG